MNIDRDTPIFGVKPVLLKALMRYERFDTPKAMSILGMTEPRVSETLRQLAESGWVSWDGDHDSIDQWCSTPLGHRLVASRLIRRFPIRQGRALLPKIVEAARILNSNPSASRRITQIILFGSILMGEDDADAGDIDLVVHVARRKLAEAKLKALIEAEEAAMPQHLDFFQRLNRQENDLLRAIKKVSGKISIHGIDDVETFAAPHRQLYRYDIKTEAEIEIDSKVQVVGRKSGPPSDWKQNMPPVLEPRGWPVAPNTPIILDAMDVVPLHLAQHLWVKGLDSYDIAMRLGLPIQSVTGYLASRNEARPSERPKFDVSLDWMINQAFAAVRGLATTVEIVKRHESEVMIECRALDDETFDELADIRIFGRSDTWISGRCDLQPMLEPVAQAASTWWDKMRDQFVGLDVRLFVLRTPAYSRAEALGSRRPDFRPLVAPMRELLERRLPKPLGREAWNHSLELLRDRGHDQLLHWIGIPRRAGSASTVITRRNESTAWRQIKAVLEPQADLVRVLGDFSLSVKACHIDGLLDAV